MPWRAVAQVARAIVTLRALVSGLPVGGYAARPPALKDAWATTRPERGWRITGRTTRAVTGRSPGRAYTAREEPARTDYTGGAGEGGLRISAACQLRRHAWQARTLSITHPAEEEPLPHAMKRSPACGLRPQVAVQPICPSRIHAWPPSRVSRARPLPGNRRSPDRA